MSDAFWVAMAGLGAAIFLGPVGQALAQRFRGRGAHATGLTTGEVNAERVAAMEERIVELEGERHQLEEQVDFAERMLLQARAEPRSLDEGGKTA